MFDMTVETIVWISLILLLSATIKGITGFGTALFAVPILTAFFLSPEATRPLIVSLNLLLNIFILVKEKNLTIKALYPLRYLVIAGFIAAVLSGFLLERMDLRTFQIILGVLLIFTAINKLFKVQFHIPKPERFFVPVGATGGILNTLIGVGGIPVLIYLSNTDYKKAQFRLSLILFFFILNVGSIISFTIHGSFEPHTLIQVLLFLPMVLIGGMIGMKIQSRINERIFQIVIASLLLVMGVNTIFNLF